jgi:hypothetical protein
LLSPSSPSSPRPPPASLTSPNVKKRGDSIASLPPLPALETLSQLTLNNVPDTQRELANSFAAELAPTAKVSPG